VALQSNLSSAACLIESAFGGVVKTDAVVGLSMKH
jgi:hypothetical protein